jgi:HD-GYP domain-containing protein (c-di-GMP phosphodiesterase class II)/HAMP domain-containing protein
MRISVPLTLQTRLGRRIALLFVLSALLPIAVMTVQGYLSVRSRAIAEARGELSRAAKSIGMGFIGQLAGAGDILRGAPGEIGRPGAAPSLEPIWYDRARSAFTSLTIVSANASRVVWGSPPSGMPLKADESVRLSHGDLVLRLDTTGRTWLVVPNRTNEQLWAAVDTRYLIEEPIRRAGLDSTMFTVCVQPTAARAPVPCPQAATGPGQLAGTWNVFLAYEFGANPWRVTVTETMDDALAPVSAFQRTFFLSMLTVIGIVVLLSSVQVRRSLQPLAELKSGVERVAQRDFTKRVAVASHDEFEDLAASFNWMTGQLDSQFRTIAAGSAIDRSALASGRGDEVAATAAARLREAMRCDVVEVLVAGERFDDGWRHVRCANGEVEVCEEVRLDAAELQQLRDAGGTWIEGHAAAGRWRRNGDAGSRPNLLFPLSSHEGLVGMVTVARAEPLSNEERVVARQLGDQLAVGLANARLLVRLNGLSYGALLALARTVDAKSHWTAGHSERVTALSLRIAHNLQLSQAELDTLRQGGLLHDIGKIGVPAAVLDHDGPLNVEQLALMRAHPAMGARILAPIAAFSPAAPIVLYHHERVDGLGYPEGLKGDDIPLLARLLAVADVYDALVSDRPYRRGLPEQLAVDAIRSAIGTQFDGTMVRAFLDVMATEGDASRFRTDGLALGLA